MALNIFRTFLTIFRPLRYGDMRIQFFVQVLSILTAVQAEYLLAERSEPELSRRQDVFAGGWSLRQSVCPTGTFQCPKYKVRR